MANQTINRPTRMLMARLASCRVVLWALVTYGPRLAEVFNGPLGRSLPEGMRAGFDQHLTQQREVLSAARDLLIERDRDRRDQRALATHHRGIRDEAFKALSPWVAGIRDTFSGACGPAVAADLGFASRMPVQPGELHEHAEHLVARLSDPELNLPAVKYQGVDLDPATVAGEMKPLVDQLGQALEDLGREERRSDATKIASDEALGAYNLTFLWVAQSTEALFRMARLPEIAKRVRPSSRRAGVTDEVESQDPETLSEDPEVATGEATDDAPVTSLEAQPDIPPAE